MRVPIRAADWPKPVSRTMAALWSQVRGIWNGFSGIDDGVTCFERANCGWSLYKNTDQRSMTFQENAGFTAEDAEDAEDAEVFVVGSEMLAL